MKNLYLQLGIAPNSSPGEIEAALQAKPELGDAAQVLLNDARRAAYNRTIATLSSIGMLRHRLGLDTDQSWFVETCPDFAPRLNLRKFVPATPAAAQSLQAENPSNSSAWSQMPVPGSHNNKRWIKVVLIVFAMAVVLALWRVFL